jgi:hypothetical protein
VPQTRDSSPRLHSLHTPCPCSGIAQFKRRCPFDFRVPCAGFAPWPASFLGPVSILYHLPGRRSDSRFGSEAMRILERLVRRPMTTVEKPFTPLRNRGNPEGVKMASDWWGIGNRWSERDLRAGCDTLDWTWPIEWQSRAGNGRTRIVGACRMP